jgi:hypothetical protein
MFTRSLYIGEPRPAEGGPSGGGQRLAAVSRWIKSGAKKAQPLVAKAGSAAIRAIRRLGVVSAASIKRFFEVLKQKVAQRRTVEPDTMSSEPAEDETSEEPIDAS